ncbi:MAG: HAD family phosphatase [Ruminococcus sp.]|nr:HAD family phosphatase [Ruminococcus sp.]
MKIKGIIFDIDGTLTDSMGVWAESDEILLGRRGIAYSKEVSEAMKSLHFMSACEYLKERFSLAESADEIGDEITEIVRDKYFHEVKLMPGVLEFARECRERGIKMCAATSNKRELAEGVLKNNGVWEYLEFLVTSDEVGSGKESPDIFFRCAGLLGTEPQETAVFEDSPHAAKTAYENGFYTVGVDSGHFGDFERLEGICSLRVKGFGEVLGVGILFECENMREEKPL